MGREKPTDAGLRCRVGDWARIVHSTDPSLIGKVVLVEEWRQEHGRWGVCLLSGPVQGRAFVTGKLIVTSRFGFRDSSLEPFPRAAGDDGGVNSVNLRQQEAPCHRFDSQEFSEQPPPIQTDTTANLLRRPNGQDQLAFEQLG